MHPILTIIVTAIGAILFACFAPDVYQKIHDHYFGKFHKNSPLKLHGKLQIGVIDAYIIAPREGKLPPESDPEAFYRKAYEEAGLGHPDLADMECLRLKIILGFNTKSLTAYVGRDKGFATLHVGHKLPHEISFTDSLPPICGKLAFMIAIDVEHQHSEAVWTGKNTLSKTAA